MLLKFHCRQRQGQVDLQLTKQVVRFIGSQARSPRKQPLDTVIWLPLRTRLGPSSAHFAKSCIGGKVLTQIPCFPQHLLPSTVHTVPLPALPPPAGHSQPAGWGFRPCYSFLERLSPVRALLTAKDRFSHVLVCLKSLASALLDF